MNGKKTLREIYDTQTEEGKFGGRVTVPVLFDKKTKKIVNNESSEIIRMLNSEFNEFAKNASLDLCPEHLKAKIDEINSWVYPNVNNGVYKCKRVLFVYIVFQHAHILLETGGFSTSQIACKTQYYLEIQVSNFFHHFFPKTRMRLITCLKRWTSSKIF